MLKGKIKKMTRAEMLNYARAEYAWYERWGNRTELQHSQTVIARIARFWSSVVHELENAPMLEDFGPVNVQMPKGRVAVNKYSRTKLAEGQETEKGGEIYEF